VTVFPALSRWRVSRACAALFVILIVLPTTAPFQTVSFTELFGALRAVVAGSVSQVPLVSTTKETAVSIVPPLDGTEGRIRNESQSSSLLGSATDTRGTDLGLALAGASIRSSLIVPVLRI
jgi:hypothetical protein